MQIPIYQVDAFSARVFGGNPAAVCPLDCWLPDETLQSIASENNVADTAFLVRDGERYRLRWFTPQCEVDLCGHATLASAFVLFRELGVAGNLLRFETKSGELIVERRGARLAVNFPARPAKRADAPVGLLEALGGPEPVEVLAARDTLVRYRSSAELLAIQPDMRALCGVEGFATIVTAPGEDCDFVSRFFAPKQGIPEDPVTGSAHCTLVPYWAAQLGKARLAARQVSARGGELQCEMLGDRVEISGEAALYLKGVIQV